MRKKQTEFGAMDTTQKLNFTHKLRHALNAGPDTLPESTIERLTSARKAALGRKKRNTLRSAYADQEFNAYLAR
jgi:Protein of unknown function (DUF3619)